MNNRSKNGTVADAAPKPKLTARGFDLETGNEAFGWLRPCDDAFANSNDLRAQLDEDGYLFIRGFWNREEVLDVRRALTDAMAAAGMLDPGRPTIDAIPHPEGAFGLSGTRGSTNAEELVRDCRPLRDLLFSGRIIRFFAHLLGGEVLAYDYTWFRTVAPGLGTVPHCDRVYMGRGTLDVFTCWTPFDDIPPHRSGLMLLEGYRRYIPRLQTYLERDVDEYCSNKPLPEHLDLESSADNKVWDGWLARNPVTLRRNLGGRWLTADYRMGDLLLFGPNIVHASLDNAGDRFRLSTDTRYQLASEPVDERWSGPGPRGHVGAAKVGRVC